MQRQEHKFFIKSTDVPKISKMLEQFMPLDQNCKNNKPYSITSTYFDSFNDQDLFDKLNGVRFREKYRLRFYNNDRHIAKFEVKRKHEYSVEKDTINLDSKKQNQILAGNYSCLKENPHFEYISHKMNYQLYKPKTVVRYDRLAYTLPFDNIRVTLDLNLRSLGFYSSYIEEDCSAGKLLMPLGYEILEIKYLGDFPNYLKQVISSYSTSRTSIGKYVLARFYNNSELNNDNPVLPF
jgi:hypothetical protein